MDDRRAHVARAVRLHPPVVGEGEALELLAKVLDHVGALGLAVDEHVDADALLLLDGVLHVVVDLTSRVFGLRERGGGVERERL